MKIPSYLEDLSPGDRWESTGYTFTEAAIIDFAMRFDPQPFHMDAEAAKETIYGGIIASGFHTLSICFRLVYQTGVFAGTGVGGKGLDELRWTRVVRPGDTIRVEVEILSAAVSSRPDRGNVQARYTARNQNGETVLTANLNHVIKARSGL